MIVLFFLSEFRSLQDKTQVVPLSKTDFVHTRLTHSLEVSVVGRSLGRKVGQLLLNKHPHLENVHGYKMNDFGAIVAAAALAHDIGNPPFGHSGEKAIGAYFKEGNGAKFKSHLTKKEYQDLCDFEGNANGFKILTESRNGREGGLRLSYATLGAFMKYPKESLPKTPSHHIADKKYGFFQSEKQMFADVALDLGLIKRSETDLSFQRHPLAYLVEAADDICYTIIDFEDGINLGLIQEEYALEYLITLVKHINRDKYSSLSSKKDRVSYLRALAINTLIDEAVSIFMENEERLLSGTFNTGLLDVSKYKAQIKDVIDISVHKVYRSNEVVNKEIAGYEILNQLLNAFGQLAFNFFNDSMSHYDKLLMNMLPEELELSKEHVYSNLSSVCLYISKLSDTQAMMLHQKLKGQMV